VRDFGYIADMLGSHMGCFLFQLPPSFHFTQARLDRILTQMDPARRNVVEFRHRSWWDEVYAAFRASRTLFCSCSAPRLPDELVKTADDVYVRFHGVKQCINMTTRRRSWQCGREDTRAGRSVYGRIVTTSGTGMQ
jgi:uncharacterized protein YecE (DUF72 family)